MNNSYPNLDEEYSKYGPKEPDQIAEQAFNWNLSCDVSLLKFMEKFSMDTIAKCNELNTKIDQINQSVTDTQLFLNKVSDKLQELFDTKVIEYKTTESSTSQNHDAENETETFETHKDFNKLEPNQFLSSCIELIDEYYEKVPFPISDNDDSNTDNFVLRPVNKFIERKLPALAATPDWLNTWHLGTASSSESEPEDMTIDDFQSETISDQINLSTTEKILTRNASLETLSSTVEETYSVNKGITTKMNFLQELQSKLTNKSPPSKYNPISIISEEPPVFNPIISETIDDNISFFNDDSPELPKSSLLTFQKVQNEPKIDNKLKLLTCLTKNRVRNKGRRLPSRKMLTKSYIVVTENKLPESSNIPKSKTCDETILKQTDNDLDEIFQSVDHKFSTLFNDTETKDDEFEALFRS